MQRISVLLIFFSFFFSQNNIQSLEAKNQKLKEAVEDLKDQIAEFNEDKDHILYQLKASDYKIRLASKKTIILSNRIQLIGKTIRKYTEQIKGVNNEQKKLQDRFASRLLRSYKMEELSLYEILTKSKNVDQFMRFMHYKDVLDKEEKGLFLKLKANEKKLLTLKGKLEGQRKREKKALEQQKNEVAELSRLKKGQDRIYKKLNSDIKLAQLAIKEKERTRKETESLIANMMKNSRKLAKNYKLSKNFKKNKGRFAWPVKGKILQRFGKVKHPKFKIYSQNNGIDIAVKKGEKVRSIHEGVVMTIQYMPGYGNSVFIDHGYGYISIFTHLDDVFVKQNELLASGAFLGTVGNSGALDGKSKLHFEIWSNNKPVNPVKWLR